MAKRMLCESHLEKDQLRLAQRYIAEIKVIDDDGSEVVHSLTEELCAADASPYTRLIEYIENKKLAAQLTAAPPPPAAPQPANPAPEVEQPDTWLCGLCVKPIGTKGRAMHARGNHDRRAQEISWQPLFDVTSWRRCSCGYYLQTDTGLSIHRRQTGCPDPDEPHPVQEEELKNETGRAVLRAINNAHNN